MTTTTPAVTVIGDPSTLYVLSDAAAMPDIYTMRRSQWEASLLNRAVVTGSTAPRVPMSAETYEVLRTERMVQAGGAAPWWAAALAVASLAVIGTTALLPGHTARHNAEQRHVVQICQDPGRAWCGAGTYSRVHYVPDGHYREDGSIPTTISVTLR